VDRIACGPHRLLGVSRSASSSDSSGGNSAPQGADSAQAEPGDSSSDSSSGGAGAVLLGLTDDVDAAVCKFSVGGYGKIAAEHVASVPALAYVAAGKVQRRAVLFGEPGEFCSPDFCSAGELLYKLCLLTSSWGRLCAWGSSGS